MTALDQATDTRRAAMDAFHTLGFPTSRNEDWKFTNIAPLANTNFTATSPAYNAELAAEMVRALPCPANRLVFVNGYFAPDLSSKTFPYRDPDLHKHLYHYAAYWAHPFIALNTASHTGGAFLEIPAGATADEPIHLVHVAIGADAPHVSYPRNLIVLGERAQATLIETYIGQGGGYFTNAVTEIALGREAILDHYKLQTESPAAFHIATIQTQQDRGSVFRSHSFSFGGALARTEVNTVLSEGSESTLNGLYVVGGNRHVDSRTSIDHAQPHATSRELYKGILDQQSSAVFNGRIIVRKDAQKTDAKQTNKNLVLSEGASINTKPELQIHADDVRCTHGATIGQLDEDAAFYLRSRGIGRDQARAILIRAFAGEIVDGIHVEELRQYVGDRIA